MLALCFKFLVELLMSLSLHVIRLIRSVWRASKFSVFKIDWNCNFVGYFTIPFGFSLFWHFLVITFQLFILQVWLRITDEGSVPEMRIWSISLIYSD